MEGNDERYLIKPRISRKKMRNLVQYRDLSDEEFDEIMKQKEFNILTSEALEERIAKKMAEFEQDYDISDLKINDKLVLRALIQALISLEDYDQLLFKIRSEGISDDNINLVDKLQKVKADLAKSISDFQNDLNITRKIRKSDKEQSVVSYLETLKEKARSFTESRMAYIFCPKCNILLGTVWTLYTKDKSNKITLTCNRKLDNGQTCGHKVTVNIAELYENGGTNKKEIMPESML